MKKKKQELDLVLRKLWQAHNSYIGILRLNKTPEIIARVAINLSASSIVPWLASGYLYIFYLQKPKTTQPSVIRNPSVSSLDLTRDDDYG